jgi:hypothetical protein
VLEEFVLAREEGAAHGAKVFSEIGDGSGYSCNWLKTRPIWVPNWQWGTERGLPFLFVSLIVYEDDFTKTLNSRIGQSIFEITPGKI